MKKTVAQGPSWAEVILGALLSVILGVVLGATLLILRPVAQVKELPKEDDRVKGTVYYLEGSKDPGKGRQAMAKRNAFLAGQSVTLTEDELNALLAAANQPGAPGAKGGPASKGDKKGAEEPAPEGGLITPGTPNVRIRDGVLQVGVPVTLDVFGLLTQTVIVQARGGFTKQGDVFVYDPDAIYLGSCPVHRVPFLASYVETKVLREQAIPEGLAAVWRNAANVAVEGNTLKIAMQ